MIIWRKSSYSGSQEGTDCVEVAGVAGLIGRAIEVRDSKQPDGPMLVFSCLEFRTLLDQVKTDAFSS